MLKFMSACPVLSYKIQALYTCNKRYESHYIKRHVLQLMCIKLKSQQEGNAGTALKPDF